VPCRHAPRRQVQLLSNTAMAGDASVRRASRLVFTETPLRTANVAPVASAGGQTACPTTAAHFPAVLITTRMGECRPHSGNVTLCVATPGLLLSLLFRAACALLRSSSPTGLTDDSIDYQHRVLG
jgi:hypothetical protein